MVMLGFLDGGWCRTNSSEGRMSEGRRGRSNTMNAPRPKSQFTWLNLRLMLAEDTRWMIGQAEVEAEAQVGVDVEEDM
jgi:hypothetical protein